MLHNLTIGHLDPAAIVSERRVVVLQPLELATVDCLLEELGGTDGEGTPTLGGGKVEFRDGYLVCPWPHRRLVQPNSRGVRSPPPSGNGMRPGRPRAFADHRTGAASGTDCYSGGGSWPPREVILSPGAGPPRYTRGGLEKVDSPLPPARLRAMMALTCDRCRIRCLETRIVPLQSQTVDVGVAVGTDELTKAYGSPVSPVYALRGVTLEVARGERVSLLGKSGSGKSTLLNLLGGLDHATSGRLRVGGHEVDRLSPRELSRFRSATVGMIFQSFNLILSRTALENVELPMIFAGRSFRERRASAAAALESVGLGKRLHHRPTEMSGGENQRVAVARALVNRPEIVLADEPTGNLDSATAQDVMGMILEHVQLHGTTLILVTHDEELAATYTDRVIRLKDGRLVS